MYVVAGKDGHKRNIQEKGKKATHKVTDPEKPKQEEALIFRIEIGAHIVRGCEGKRCSVRGSARRRTPFRGTWTWQSQERRRFRGTVAMMLVKEKGQAGQQ